MWYKRDRTILWFFIIFISGFFNSNGVEAAGYFNWKFFSPPTNMSTLPQLRLGSTFSLTGGSVLPGTADFQSMQLCVQRINELGGAWHLGQQYAVTMTYLDDGSTPDFANYLYQIMASQVAHRLAPLPGQTPLDILFAPHTTPLTLAALTSVKPLNVSLWTVGSSSPIPFTGYPYIWGNTKLADTWMLDAWNVVLTLPIQTVAIVFRSDAANLIFYASALKTLQAANLNIVFIAQIPASIPSGGDPASLTAFLNPTLTNSSFPQTVDLFLLIGAGYDMYYTALALQASGKAPKLALYSTFYVETPDQMLAQEGWVGIFPQRLDDPTPSTLPGVMFKNGPEFTAYFEKMFGVAPVPSNEQQVAAFEAMLAAINISASLSSDDLRTANLALNGRTLFGPLKYDPKIGSNPAQQLLPWQVQNGKSVLIKSKSDLVFPVPWSWTIPIVYDQTSSQFALMIVILVFLAGVVAVALVCVRFKSSRVLHAASPSMMALVLLGNAMVLVAAVLEVQIPNRAMCTTQSWLFNIGFTMSLGALFLKTFRLHSIFHSKQLTLTSLSDRYLISVLFLMICWDCLLLAIRTGVAPYSDKPSLQMCQLSADLSTDASRVAAAMAGLLVATKGALLLCGAVLCFLARHLPSLYNESNFLAVCIYNTGVISLIWLVIIHTFDFDSTATSLSLFEASAMLIGVVQTTCLLFLPKFVTVIRNGEHRIQIHKGPHHDLNMTFHKGPLNAPLIKSNKSNSTTPKNAGASPPPPPTLTIVLDALNALLIMLELKLERGWKELSKATQLVDQTKRDIADSRQSIAIVQAEQDYLVDNGSTMTDVQLAQMLLDRSNSSGSEGSDESSMDPGASSTLSSRLPPSPAAPPIGLPTIAHVYRRVIADRNERMSPDASARKVTPPGGDRGQGGGQGGRQDEESVAAVQRSMVSGGGESSYMLSEMTSGAHLSTPTLMSANLRTPESDQRGLQYQRSPVFHEPAGRHLYGHEDTTSSGSPQQLAIHQHQPYQRSPLRPPHRSIDINHKDFDQVDLSPIPDDSGSASPDAHSLIDIGVELAPFQQPTIISMYPVANSASTTSTSSGSSTFPTFHSGSSAAGSSASTSTISSDQLMPSPSGSIESVTLTTPTAPPTGGEQTPIIPVTPTADLVSSTVSSSTTAPVASSTTTPSIQPILIHLDQPTTPATN